MKYQRRAVDHAACHGGSGRVGGSERGNAGQVDVEVIAPEDVNRRSHIGGESIGLQAPISIHSAGTRSVNSVSRVRRTARVARHTEPRTAWENSQNQAKVKKTPRRRSSP